LNFSLSENQLEIQKMAARFAEKELLPIVEEDERNSHFRPELFRKLGDLGLLGITTEEEFGGIGFGTSEYVLFLEELAKVASGYATSISVTGLVIAIINASNNPALKKKYLPALLSGEKIGAFCLTEPSSGSDAGALQTKATNKGSAYILNGTKQFITNGMHADIFIVMARTKDVAGPRGVAAFLLEKDFGVKGGKFEKKMGMRTSPTQELFFENVEVPAENRIGQEGEGFTVAKDALDGGRISIGSIANGIAGAALSRALSYAKEREQFGSPILKNQGISFLLSEMATELECSRLLIAKAAFEKDQGRPFRKIASMAKLKATESCMKTTTDAVQILGGYGYMEEYQVERYMREAKMMQIVEGTSQIQRIVIAKEL